MATKKSQNRGVLLGLAVGDAMGHTVDSRSLEEICADYGPNGLLGYDLVNGYADITSYTQIAAFTANGLLLGMTRGQTKGRVLTLNKYISTALKEWSRTQMFSLPEKNYCWLTRIPEMKRKFCMDTRMLDALSREELGCLEYPQYKSNQSGSLTAVVPIALLQQDLDMCQSELNRLAADTVALTHGEPEAFLTGATLNHLLCLLLNDSSLPIAEAVQQSIHAVQLQFGNDYGHQGKIWELLQLALTLAVSPNVAPMDAMQNLSCRTAAEVLAGAVYAVATCNRDFDSAMIIAVNHSGRSSAVGAITGALLGAILGYDALPEFYLESLDASQPLTELADDMASGFSEMVGRSLFDMDWDRKYLSAGK